MLVHLFMNVFYLFWYVCVSMCVQTKNMIIQTMILVIIKM